MTREQEIQNFMKVLELTREEAEQLWEDDHSNKVSDEVKEIEQKAKKLSHREKSDAPRKKVVREKKEDPIKREIIATIANNLSRCWFDELANTENEPHLIHVKNPEREICFKVGEDNYSVTLIKHRAPK